MAEPIEIPISFPGAEDGAGDVDDAAEALRLLALRQQAAATAAINLGQRLAGASSAVQGLIGQLGGQSRTAGLIGATLQTSVQFAQLGAGLGPGGALVGGILGALIPAIRELISAQDDAAESARALQHEEEMLTERGQRMAEERREQVRLEVESGAILTLSEEEISRATSLAAERRIEIYGQLQTVAGALRRAEEQGMDHTSGRFREWTEQAATLRTELLDVTAQINNLDRVTLERGVAGSVLANEGGGGGTTPPPTRGGGTDHSAERQREALEFKASLAAADQADSDARMARLEEEYEANERLVSRKLVWQSQLDEADKQSAQEERERDEARLESLGRQQDAALAQMQEHQQAVTEQASATGAELISTMTNVISQIAEGNATAEEGAQLMLAAFLQALSQRAQIEALASVAQAISSAASMNFAGMAGHIAAALAWGAVAVATGVGGSAISAGVSRAQATRAEAERPAAARSSETTEGKGGGTTVINFNGAVVTAQTTAELGRTLDRTVGVARRRFGEA